MKKGESPSPLNSSFAHPKPIHSNRKHVSLACWGPDYDRLWCFPTPRKTRLSPKLIYV
jgi:hypothetical protein